MPAFETITADTLAAHLAAGQVAQLWNVLTDDYFTGTLIPGSRRVPLDTVGREVATLALPKDAAVVVYCSGPTCPQSRAAAEKLATLGYTRVRLFEGGLQEWTESGREVEQVAAAA
jgi:rhodanese-related sulfurtransferase